MPDFVTLSCPTCGGQLQITQDINRFACAHCGNEHVVNRGGGIITLAPVVQGLDDIRRGTDRTAAELKIRRLKEEMGEAEEEVMALAYSLLESDWNGVVSELGKLVKWAPQLRGQSVSDRMDQLRMYNQEIIAGISTDAMESLSQSYQSRSGWFAKPKAETVAIFPRIIGLKRQIDDKRSQIEDLKGV